MNVKEILEKHRKWLAGEDGGERANLSGADLSRADLSGANLSGAYLSEADLSGANLSGAYLSEADLSEADLSGANLSGANLSEADLSRANLYGADLYGANLSRANLSGADLYGANLYGAYLSEADLSRANLYGADLYGANLSRANLSGANLSGAYLSRANFPLELVNKFYPICCPEYGAFVAWKKANGKVVKLMVEETAKRSSAYGRKCRCSSALCLAIENLDGTDSGLTQIASDHDSSFIYRVGEVVKVDNFDDDRRNECAPGVHFFITRQEAVDY